MLLQFDCYNALRASKTKVKINSTLNIIYNIRTNNDFGVFLFDNRLIHIISNWVIVINLSKILGIFNNGWKVKCFYESQFRDSYSQ
jgi:hypothetical protein